MTSVHYSKLTGRALDYAVVKARGGNTEVFMRRWQSPTFKNYSTSWDYTGPLIAEYGMEFGMFGGYIGAQFQSEYIRDHGPVCHAAGGKTHLEAACRAVVVYELGNEVDIPEELT